MRHATRAEARHVTALRAKPGKRMRAPSMKPSWKPVTAMQQRRRLAIEECWKTQVQVAADIKAILKLPSFSRQRVGMIWRGKAGSRVPALRLAFCKSVGRTPADLGWSDDGTEDLDDGAMPRRPGAAA